MKKLFINCSVAFFMLLSADSISAQVLNLGSISNFVVFTGNGAISNTGASTLTGDVGSDIGAITLSGATVIGSVFNADATTAQALTDLQSAYTQLISIPATNTVHAPAFGGSETLTTGVYMIGGAGSLAGTLTLDGQGDSSAVFIFRFGGAFDTGAASSVILANGTLPCNVFWISEGAITLAASTIMEGTLLSHDGAVSIAAGGKLEGRMLSTNGAISIDNAILSQTVLCANPIPLSIELLFFTAECKNPNIEFKWETSSEQNNHYFTIQQSSDGYNWRIVSHIDGAGNSSAPLSYSYTDPTRYTTPGYFRLLETNTNGVTTDHSIIYLKNCGIEQEGLTVSPNPSNGFFGITYSGNEKKVVSMVVTDLTGKTVYTCNGFESVISLNGVDGSVFLLHIYDGTSTITQRLIIMK